MSFLYIADREPALQPTVTGAGIVTLAEFLPVMGGETLEDLPTPKEFHGPQASTDSSGDSFVGGSNPPTGLLVTKDDPSELAETSCVLGPTNHDRQVGKPVDPKLREFVKRVFVPALVKRYILAAKRERLAALSTAKA